MANYNPKKIEKKWQDAWRAERLYAVPETDAKKYYILDMFPYPSGEGLHVGHPKGYIASDTYARFKRKQGYAVLHPMGWDAFGLPAENFAIKTKTHPRKAVEKNIARYKEQLERIGFDYDWEREINTTDPSFYKWTQWIFLQMYKKGLAYESHAPINWCPSCQTGLANEDVEDGLCERCGTKVEKKPMRQWVLRITDYAERLLSGLADLNWPESIKESQRNWIGKSEGAVFTFPLVGVAGQDNRKHSVEVFTTRPDTIHGVTFLAVSPELAQKWVSVGWQASNAVREYVANAIKSRIAIGTGGVRGKAEKTGIDAGIFAVHPATQEKIAVWVADYVMSDVGTGAIMGVPAHDERDAEFTRTYSLPIKHVLEPVTGTPAENEQKRKSIVAIVKNPATGRYLSLNWGPKYGGSLFIGGGREEGEEPITTALREIAEETGYVDAEFISHTGITHHHYFAFSKGVARNTEVVGLYFELQSEQKIAHNHQADEAGKFAVEWLSESEVLAKIEDENHALIFQTLVLGKPFTGEGLLVGSGEYDGLSSEEAKKRITKAYGKPQTNYRLQDWVFSRQRYWGEPIPLIHCAQCGVVPVPEKDLPVLLPEVDSYQPTGTGESPLADMPEWVNVPCPSCGGAGKRETNTMPQWAGSSWYWLRYMDPRNGDALVAKDKEKRWSPVDVYVGGAEHATRHLIYARFWHKFLFDIGAVSTEEPFARLQHVGLILAEDGKKMSKRYGNVVNPDDVVEQFGADTLRVYESFMGPFAQSIAWNTDSIVGSRRFLERVWRLAEKVSDNTEMKDSPEMEKVLHKTIRKVGDDIESFSFNTAISQLMILVNEMEKTDSVSRAHVIVLVHLLSPFAPHITEELWHTLGESGSVHSALWPEYDERKMTETAFTVAVQVNGKVRATVAVQAGESEESVKAKAFALPEMQKWLGGKEPTRIIYIKEKVLNIVLTP